MKSRSLVFLCLLLVSASFAQTGKTYEVKSPDGKISLSVNAGATVNWSVKHEDSEIITPSQISLTLDHREILGKSAIVKKVATTTVNETFTTPVYKKNSVSDNYNQLTINFKGDYGLIFRAYNDGIAYRFFTQRKGDIAIVNEAANFNFKDDDKAFLPFVNDYRNKDKFNVSFEAHYDNLKLSSFVWLRS